MIVNVMFYAIMLFLWNLFIIALIFLSSINYHRYFRLDDRNRVFSEYSKRDSIKLSFALSNI